MAFYSILTSVSPFPTRMTYILFKDLSIKKGSGVECRLPVWKLCLQVLKSLFPGNWWRDGGWGQRGSQLVKYVPQTRGT